MQRGEAAPRDAGPLAVGFMARALGLSRPHQRIFTAAVWLWAVLPNLALIVLFATAPN